MSVALINGQVLREDGLAEGQCLLLSEGRILDIVAPSARRVRRAERYDLGGQLLLRASSTRRSTRRWRALQRCAQR